MLTDVCQPGVFFTDGNGIGYINNHTK